MLLNTCIFTASDLNIEANQGQNSIISGNTSLATTENGYYTNKTAIFASGTEEKPTELTLTAKNGGKLVIDDEISGNNYKIKVTGDKTGVVYLNNNIRAFKDKNFSIMYDINPTKLDNTLHPADITLENTNLVLGRRASVLDGHNLTLNSGALSLANGIIDTSSLNSLTVTGNTNIYTDVDLANSQMDRLEAKTYGKHTGNLNVAGMNLLSDAKLDKTEIYFADKGLKGNVTTTVSDVAYTPIYKYNVKYDNRNDGGYFVFDRLATGGGTSPSTNPSTAFNPAILASPVAAQAGATATMNHTFNYAFQNADNFMNIPYLDKIAIKNSQKYALAVTEGSNTGNFSPLYTNADSSSIWVKPYASFENIPLKNGPKVSSISYGTLVGYDTNLVSMKKKAGIGYGQDILVITDHLNVIAE